MNDDGLGLEDDDFWGDPWRTRKAAQRKLMEREQDAFVIDAPKKVALDAHADVPLAILRVCKLSAEPALDFARCAVVAAMDLDTDELRAGLALDPAPGGPPRLAEGGPPTAMLGEAHLVDLGARIGVPARRGEHAVSVICLDRVSNRRHVKVVESRAYEDPAVAAFLREHLATGLGRPAAWPAPVEGEAMPSYERQEESPPLPADVDIGITLGLDRVSIIPLSRVPVFGSFRLPVGPRSVVDGGNAAGAPLTALVPITLLLTGTAEPAPRLVSLVVPTHAPLQRTPDGQAIATGHFAVDLRRLLTLTAASQTYFVYAFSGAVMAGPFPTAFVQVPLPWRPADRAR